MTKLTSINIPKNVKTILDGALYECTSLTNISGNVVIVPARCFYGCSALKTVTFTSLSAVGINAFRKCSMLNSCYTQ